MVRLLTLLCFFPLASCFPDAKFVMQESLTEYECAPELVAEMCIEQFEKLEQLEKQDGI